MFKRFDTFLKICIRYVFLNLFGSGKPYFGSGYPFLVVGTLGSVVAYKHGALGSSVSVRKKNRKTTCQCKQVILVIFSYYLRYKMEEKPKSNVTMPQIQLLIYTMARGPNNLIES